MTVTTDPQSSLASMPDALRTVQAAIQLTEVQAMLHRLTDHNPGICMPHMHDEQTGDFQRLPDAMMQEESGLEMSFQSTQDVADKTYRFLPVAWIWRATPSAIERDVEHKMPTS